MEREEELYLKQMLDKMWNNFTCDRFLAGGTEGASGGMIVDLAVRLPLVVKVVTPRERYPTHLKREWQE